MLNRTLPGDAAVCQWGPLHVNPHRGRLLRKHPGDGRQPREIRSSHTLSDFRKCTPSIFSLIEQFVEQTGALITVV